MPGPRSSGGDAKKSKTLLIGGTWWLVTGRRLLKLVNTLPLINQAIFSLSLECDKEQIGRPSLLY